MFCLARWIAASSDNCLKHCFVNNAYRRVLYKFDYFRFSIYVIHVGDRHNIHSQGSLSQLKNKLDPAHEQHYAISGSTQSIQCPYQANSHIYGFYRNEFVPRLKKTIDAAPIAETFLPKTSANSFQPTTLILIGRSTLHSFFRHRLS
jgi:hypothetical protein